MAFITLSSGLTIKIPTLGTVGWWASFLDDFAKKISAHDHTGSGKGAQIVSNAIVANAITAPKLAADAVETAKIKDAAVTAEKLAPGVAVPVGKIMMDFIKPADDGSDGWIALEGQTVVGANFNALVAKWGTNVMPDFRDVSPIGASTVALKAKLGALNHTHTGPSHTHTTNSHTHNAPAHYHSKGNLAIGSGGTHTTEFNHSHTANSVAAGTHSHVFYWQINASGTDAEDGGFPVITQANRHVQVYEDSSVAIESTGSHTHAINVQGIVAVSQSDGSHTHANSAITGSVGATSSANGDAAMETSGSGTLTSSASGTGSTGTANAPVIGVYFVAKL